MPGGPCSLCWAETMLSPVRGERGTCIEAGKAGRLSSCSGLRIGSVSDARLRPRASKLPGASHIWGGNRLAGNSCQRWLELHSGFGRGTKQAQGPAAGRLRRSLIWVRRDGPQARTSNCRGQGAGVRVYWSESAGGGGQWAMAGAVFRARRGAGEGCQGGVAGGVPPHKGGPQARTSNCSGQWSVASCR